MRQHKTTNNSKGQLYIVSTPIGNLSDITKRALTTLHNVDLIAAEDTRHTGLLLNHFGIKTNLTAFYDHKEKQKAYFLTKKLKKGQNIALVSNAGTPLINDPGYRLVRLCREEGIRVIPIPGPCAAIAALSAAGLPSDRFYYAGFLPTKSKSRCDVLESLKNKPYTIIFYESTHRLLKSLEDMIHILGSNRYIVIARELTKTWETIYGAPLSALLKWIKENKSNHKGEIVLIVEGYTIKENIISAEALRTFSILKLELSIKQAVALTASIHGVKKNMLYKHALKQQGK